MKNYPSKIIYILFILGLCFVLTPQPLWAQTPGPAQTSPQLSTSISEARSFGYWEKMGKHGRYRIVIVNDGWEHVSSEAFIQAIEEDSEKQDLVLFSNTPIKEINDSGIWSVSISRVDYGNKKVIVTLDGVNTYSPSEKKQFRITLLEPGKYQLGN